MVLGYLAFEDGTHLEEVPAVGDLDPALLLEQDLKLDGGVGLRQGHVLERAPRDDLVVLLVRRVQVPANTVNNATDTAEELADLLLALVELFLKIT